MLLCAGHLAGQTVRRSLPLVEVIRDPETLLLKHLALGLSFLICKIGQRNNDATLHSKYAWLSLALVRSMKDPSMWTVDMSTELQKGKKRNFCLQCPGNHYTMEQLAE